MRILLVLVVTGCAIQKMADDTMNNRFLEATPIAVSFGGAYSGTIGPYILTYKIASDGTGISCYYQSGTAVVHKVRVYSKNGNAYGLVHETGAIGAFHVLGEGGYALESYGQKHKLLPDNDLALSNLNCKARLLQTN